MTLIIISLDGPSHILLCDRQRSYWGGLVRESVNGVRSPAKAGEIEFERPPSLQRHVQRDDGSREAMLRARGVVCAFGDLWPMARRTSVSDLSESLCCRGGWALRRGEAGDAGHNWRRRHAMEANAGKCRLSVPGRDGVRDWTERIPGCGAYRCGASVS